MSRSRTLCIAVAALLLGALPGALPAIAQSGGNPSFPLPLGPTNAGKEFWFSFPTNWDASSVTTKYIRLYITSNVTTTVTIEAGGATQTVTTVPFDVVTADLTPENAQVIVRNDQGPVPPDQVYTKRAIHIVADDPIVVYGLNRTSYTTDGMLILPTNALGQEYVIASAADIADGVTQKLPSQYVVVAPHDSTTVTITNPMASPNHGADTAFTIVMGKGDVFSSMSVGVLGDLSGALISADRPIAVMAGQNCTYLPNRNYCCCDHIEEMLLPVESWGKVYHSVPYAGRTKGDLYRIFAGEDNAQIYINGVKIGTLAKKGGAMGIGWLEYLPQTRGRVDISSDKPISVAQYNNSGQYDNTQSDPFSIMLTPADQYMTEIVFATPSQDYPKNYINLVSDSAGYGSLEIAAGASGAWESVASKYGQPDGAFATTFNGKTMVGSAIEIPPGTYRLRGASPFAAYIYGSSAYDSYGYPLAAQLANHSVNDSVAPGLLPRDPDSTGSAGGTITELPPDPSRRSNISTIDLDPSVSANYTLRVDPFIPGITSSIGYHLSVKDRTKDALAVVVAVDMAGNRTQDTVSYTARPSTSEVRSDAAFPAGYDLSSHLSGAAERLEIAYTVPTRGAVTMELFDAKGARIASILEGRVVDQGTHDVSLGTGLLPSGLYLLRLSANGVSLGSRVVIAR